MQLPATKDSIEMLWGNKQSDRDRMVQYGTRLPYMCERELLTAHSIVHVFPKNRASRTRTVTRLSASVLPAPLPLISNDTRSYTRHAQRHNLLIFKRRNVHTSEWCEARRCRRDEQTKQRRRISTWVDNITRRSPRMIGPEWQTFQLLGPVEWKVSVCRASCRQYRLVQKDSPYCGAAFHPVVIWPKSTTMNAVTGHGWSKLTAIPSSVV